MNTDFKARLRDKKLLQKDAAAALGVSEATLSQWFSALRAGQHGRVPAERARKLAELLGVAPGAIRPDLWPVEVAA